MISQNFRFCKDLCLKTIFSIHFSTRDISFAGIFWSSDLYLSKSIIQLCVDIFKYAITAPTSTDISLSSNGPKRESESVAKSRR